MNVGNELASSGKTIENFKRIDQTSPIELGSSIIS